MATDAAWEQEPAGADRRAERERLLAAVRTRLDGLGVPAGTTALHTAGARAETDALLRHLVGTGPDGAYDVDQEVAYTLGVTLLIRADDRREAPTAEQEARYGLVLLAPFYCHLPGTPDVLPPPLRAALDELLGPEGRRPEEPRAIVHEHAASLSNVAMLLLELGIVLSWPAAWEAAARLTRQAMPCLSPEGPDRALAGCNLGYALLLGAGGAGADPERLAEAVDVLRAALADTPDDHPNRARCANGLGLALLAWAGAREDRALLAESAESLRTATRCAGAADDNVAQMHSDLGYVLTAYALSAGAGEEVGPRVREEAVGALRRSLELTPAGETDLLRDRLGRLAEAVLIGVAPGDRARSAGPAAEAVEVLARLLGLTPAGHPERADVLLRLADALVAARRPQEAVDLLGGADADFAGDAERTARAGRLMRRAAVLKGELSSREGLSPEQRADSDAIDGLMRSALSGEGDGHPIAAVMRLLGMGGPGGGSRGQELMDFGSLLLGYPEEVSLDDVMTRAVEMELRRVSRLPEEERAQALADLMAGGGADPEPPPPRQPVDTTPLDELQEVHERLLLRLAPDSPEYRMAKEGQAMLALARVMHDPGPDEERLARMRASLPLLRGLIEDLPGRMREMGLTPELFGGYTALAYASESPFDQLRYLEGGVRGARRRLAGLTPGSREHAETRTSLAVSLFIRYVLWSEEADFTEAVEIARELTAVPEPDLRTVMLLTQWTSAVNSRLRNVQLLDGEGPAPAGRPAGLITRLASDQAAKALDGRDPVAALESLEDGRAHLLSTALNARRELSGLHGADADLHDRLRTALDRLHSLRKHAEPGRWPSDEETAAYRTAQEDAARVITELQGRPGFRRFLTPLPLGLDDLLPAAAEGPVVSVNVHPRRCDALVLGADGLRTVRLPRLYASDLVAQAESFRLAVEVLTAGPRDPLHEEAREVFTGTLAWLWDVLAEPVLDCLGLTGPPGPGAPWPRLWWSPSGVLNSFPLHAAGHHGPGAPAGAAVLDRVASSYTPTLRALLYSRARRRADPGRRRVLAVAMPHTAGQAPLARTVAEATAAVAAGGGTPLIGPAATREAVRSAVLDAAVVHFACHADGDPEDTAAGRLLLADGDLLIGDIADLRLESAELAYLSACGTARGSADPALVDEVIHLASAFQLAGYTQSVATLWEVGDVFAAEAAAAFHRALSPALPAPGPLPAALALHDTVRALRTAAPDHPWTWAALVHAGA
ncbi:CHAT domain-containing protein [Streptomyces collinus]|uniref:CHAT domain-containing protein n=1 Tax=Streptomyces collinus TaxID=42684 RepID=UPI002942A82C|nr:CHAT domain-containing protein [Streptomyces collinus]